MIASRRAAAVLLVVATACTTTRVPHPVDPFEDLGTQEVSLPWSIQSGSVRRFSVQVTDGGCVQFRRLEVVEEAEVVHVRAIGELDRPASASGKLADCPSDLRFVPAKLDLKNPLGPRVIAPAPWTFYSTPVVEE